MYQIYSDDILIYDSSLEDYVISKGSITKELNKSGSFVFTIYSNNPFYNAIQKMKSIITVLKNDSIIFRGRVIKEVIGFYKDKTFTCEGELGFLRDAIFRPYEFTGEPVNLFNQLIEAYNSQVDDNKKFTVGTVTVTDPNNYINRSNSDYDSVSDNLYDKLLDTLGGYIFITGTKDKRVINWFSESPYRSNQSIEFGENLLEFTKTNGVENIITALIPLGAEIEDGEVKRNLTIAEVNNGKDYIYDPDAVALYGWIYGVEKWKDVTLASNLKTKGEAFLAEKIKQSITIELSAIDLSLMDKSIDSFELGDYINIVSYPHNLDDDYLLEKQNIDLLKPDNDKITLGYSFSSFTDASVTANNANNTLIKTVETIQSNYATNAVVSSQVNNLQTQIDQTSETIKMSVSNEIMVNEELQALLSTTYTQLNNTFEFMFNNLDTIVNQNDADVRAMFSEINKYIRFVDGNIIIGEIGNPLTLKLTLDRISFLENDAEIAYISGNKIHITDANITNSIRIGNFALVPRETGHLSMTKVRA